MSVPGATVLDRPSQPRAVASAYAGRVTAARVALVALTVTTFLQIFRLLLPLEWVESSEIGLVVAAAAFPLLFLAPLLAPLYRRFGRRSGLLTAVGVLVAARLALQLAVPAPFWLAVAAMAAALTAVVPIMSSAGDHRDGATVVSFGVVVGFALDVALRGAYGTWDYGWRSGSGPLLVAIVALAGLVMSAVVLTRRGDGLGDEPLRGRAPRAAVLGLLLGPEVLFLQSPAFLASSGEVALPWAIGIVIAASAVALVAAAAALRHPSRPVGVVAGLALAAVVFSCPSAAGQATVIALVVAGQVAAAVLLATVLSGEPVAPRRASLTRSAVGATGGLLASYVAVLLYQLHYEHPLPLSNTWLPTLVVLGATACLAAARTTTRDAATASSGALAIASVGIVFAALAVGIGFDAGAAHPTVVPQATWPLRVMTYNVSGAVTRGGVIDVAAIADEIRRSGADVVSLQEVYRGWPLGGTVDVAGWLQRELGWQQVWAPAADRQAGNLLLSRVRLSNVHVLGLPRGEGSMDRSAAVADVTVDGTVVHLLNAHLQHRNSPGSMQARQQETAVLLAEIDGRRETVLMGDLNPRNPDLVDLRAVESGGLTTALNATRCTAPTSNDNCSDYIFVAPGLTQSDAAVVPSSPFDHRPVLATVTLAPH